MITDETHPEMVRAQADLVNRLGIVTLNRAPSREFYKDVITVRDDHRADWRLKGVDFPHLVIFAIPRLRILELWRADLDFSSIRTKMMNLVLAAPEITMSELSAALHASYPDFGIRGIVDEGEAALDRIRRRAIDGTILDSVTLRARKNLEHSERRDQ